MLEYRPTGDRRCAWPPTAGALWTKYPAAGRFHCENQTNKRLNDASTISVPERCLRTQNRKATTDRGMPGRSPLLLLRPLLNQNRWMMPTPAANKPLDADGVPLKPSPIVAVALITPPFALSVWPFACVYASSM